MSSPDRASWSSSRLRSTASWRAGPEALAERPRRALTALMRATGVASACRAAHRPVDDGRDDSVPAGRRRRLRRLLLVAPPRHEPRPACSAPTAIRCCRTGATCPSATTAGPARSSVSGTPSCGPTGLVPTGDGVPQRRPDAARSTSSSRSASSSGSAPTRPADRAPTTPTRHVFGVVLLNDWSARDIQAFEYQPLGPFLGKSFATTISPWVVHARRAAAVPRRPARRRTRRPTRTCAATRPWGLDLDLAVELNGSDDQPRPTFADLYWTFAQQLAHMTVNGATTAPGDLFALGHGQRPDAGRAGQPHRADVARRASRSSWPTARRGRSSTTATR